jgi:hypothetical protein
MFDHMATNMGLDIGVVVLGLFCLFWLLLGLGGAILALTLPWPWRKDSTRAQEKDPGLAQDEHLHHVKH